MTDISRLVLARKVYQSINIGGLITVTVEEIRGKTVRISVEAPREVAVHRQEIYERIQGGGDDDGGAGIRIPVDPGAGPVRPAGPGGHERGTAPAPRARLGLVPGGA